MKVLDPQSALLTTSEVHQFLAGKPPRPAPRKIGAFKLVDLSNYKRVRTDFQHYITSTVPHIAQYPPPESFIHAVVPKLRALGLTKTEALVLINLGIGLPRSQQVQPPLKTDSTGGEDEEGDEAVEEDPGDPDDSQMLALVIEEFEERFPGEESEAKVEEILQTMRAEYDRAVAAHASTNGHGNKSVAENHAPE